MIDTPLWVDDSKPAPEGCAIARTYDDALQMLTQHDYSTLYLDHDLGDSQGRTGLDLLRKLIELDRVPPAVQCISWNPVGRQNIEAELVAYMARKAHQQNIHMGLWP